MKKGKLAAWEAATVALNAGKKLRRGALVVDWFGDHGVVVKIEEWPGEPSTENHGTVYVWQIDRTEYGADNCEHYPYYNWESKLRILEE